MLLLNKNRIILFILVIFVSILVYLILFYNDNAKHTYVSSENLDKRTIVVDAGHRETR